MLRIPFERVETTIYFARRIIAISVESSVLIMYIYIYLLDIIIFIVNIDTRLEHIFDRHIIINYTLRLSHWLSNCKRIKKPKNQLKI